MRVGHIPTIWTRLGLAIGLAAVGACGGSGGTGDGEAGGTADDDGEGGSGDASGGTAQGEDGPDDEGDDGDDEAPSADEGEPVDPEDLEWPYIECDPINPSYCAFPWPSNVHTIPDPATSTGRRVILSAGVFAGENTEPWRYSDGFSGSSAIMAHFPSAVGDGLPSHEDLSASLQPTSKTILLDADTGELVPHFSELDATTTADDQRTLLIRPAVRLLGGHRHIVAIQGLVDATGAEVSPSPAFKDLRDDTNISGEASVEKRRALYGDIFARLAEVGVDRDDVQLAWDFTTASDLNTTGWLLHMRDETFAALGSDGSPPFTIDDVDTNWNAEQFLFKVEGTFEAPLYLTQPGPGEPRLVLGGDGRPTQNGTLDVPFTLIVPRTAENAPAALVQHGHGLLGTRGQIEAGHFQELATAYNYAIFSIDWIGMASEDQVFIGLALAEGKGEGLASMMDRLHQGSLNHLLAMRVMWAGLARDPMFEGLLDPDQRYYYGISQGGILGGVYMGTTLDVERGVLDVLGQPYNLLLTRSVDFDTFFTIIRAHWPDPRDVQYVLGATQMLWDRVEPSGYTPFIRDPLPNTPPHEVLLTAALGDHQVTTLGAQMFARSIGGVRHLDTGLREVWGLEPVRGSWEGSAYVEYDFGLPPDPFCNLPQTACEDPHGRLRNLPPARDQIDTFLRTGVIENLCPEGVCSYPTEGGCGEDAQTPDVCMP